jgi:2-polyprenyl-3-methyl-5-hydroxy-6-metoxy-1,4-benzoquinol methylase
MQHPLVQERINLKVARDAHIDRFQYFLNAYLKDRLPVECALTLGCGAGDLERGLSQYNFAKLHDAIDVSETAIHQAKQQAEAAGLPQIRYRLADLNSLELDPDRYDVIFGVSSVHHVAGLEHLYEQVQRALRPGGYFFLDEYIGPTQFQWTDEQLEAINAELRSLPGTLRRSVSEPGEVKQASDPEDDRSI